MPSESLELEEMGPEEPVRQESAMPSRSNPQICLV